MWPGEKAAHMGREENLLRRLRGEKFRQPGPAGRQIGRAGKRERGEPLVVVLARRSRRCRRSSYPSEESPSPPRASGRPAGVLARVVNCAAADLRKKPGKELGRRESLSKLKRSKLRSLLKTDGGIL